MSLLKFLREKFALRLSVSSSAVASQTFPLIVPLWGLIEQRRRISMEVIFSNFLGTVESFRLHKMTARDWSTSMIPIEMVFWTTKIFCKLCCLVKTLIWEWRLATDNFSGYRGMSVSQLRWKEPGLMWFSKSLEFSRSSKSSLMILRDDQIILLWVHTGALIDRMMGKLTRPILTNSLDQMVFSSRKGSFTLWFEEWIHQVTNQLHSRS